MSEDQLDRIEEAYETRIGMDAKVIRALVQEIRRLLQEREEAAWSER